MMEHVEYQAGFRYGHRAQELVARWFREYRKIQVRVPVLKVAPTKEEAKKFGDGGDLFLLLPPRKGEFNLEVKTTSRRFTCQADFPFDPAIVDTVYSADRKPSNTIGYFIVNDDLLCGLFVPIETKRYWVRRYVKNGKTGNTDLSYKCPLRYLIEYKMPGIEVLM